MPVKIIPGKSVKVAYSQSEILAQVAELTNNIADRVDDIAQYIADAAAILEDAERDSAIEKAAFVEAKQYIDDFVTSYVTTSILQAAAATVEFNWPSYLEHLTNAIVSNIEELVGITYNEGERTISVSVDLTPLGELDDWGDAVQQAREEGGFGLTEGNIMRSYFWKEKIYGVDREGNRLIKIEDVSYEDVQSMDDESALETGEDITDRYIGLYTNTIELRLSLIDDDKAPFWVLIEEGNVSAKFSKDSGGIAYPTFGPANMQAKIVENISAAFSEAYDSFKSAAVKKLADILNVGSGAMPIGQDVYDDLEEAVVQFAEREFQVEAKEVKPVKKEGYVYFEVKDQEFRVEAFGAGAIRLRGKGGQFVKKRKA